MAGLRVWVSGLSIMFLIGASAPAFNVYPLPPGGGPVLAPRYYVPSPVVYGPFRELSQIPCPCWPVPQIRFACPTPAPSTPGPGVLSSHEPPLAAKSAKIQGPIIDQRRNYGGGDTQMNEPKRDLCEVTFWNLSGVNVKLSVDDSIVRNIAKDKGVTLDLKRTFTWQTDLPSSKAESVADDLNYFAVLIK